MCLVSSDGYSAKIIFFCGVQTWKDFPREFFYQIYQDAMRHSCVTERIEQSCPKKMSCFAFKLPNFQNKMHRNKAKELFLMNIEWKKDYYHTFRVDIVWKSRKENHKANSIISRVWRCTPPAFLSNKFWLRSGLLVFRGTIFPEF